MQAIARTFRNKDRGFTLIELLVVIAIIAVLAALILAALSSAQKGSRDSRRKSDLNQYKTSLAQFQSDTGGYPVSAAANITGTGVAPCNATNWTANYMTGGGGCLTDTNSHNYVYAGTAAQFAVCAWLERTANNTDGTENFVVGPTYSGTGDKANPVISAAVSTAANCTVQS